MMYLIMALDSLHYAGDHPDRVGAIKVFENLLIESEDRFQFQPAVSPIWDTSYAAFALGEMGSADPDAMRRSADWMLDRECRRKGDFVYCYGGHRDLAIVDPFGQGWTSRSRSRAGPADR